MAELSLFLPQWSKGGEDYSCGLEFRKQAKNKKSHTSEFLINQFSGVQSSKMFPYSHDLYVHSEKKGTKIIFGQVIDIIFFRLQLRANANWIFVEQLNCY